MDVLDHSNTYVLLIGASDFPEDPNLHSIPNVLSNIQSFKKILTNSEIIGIPDTNITVSLNEDRSKIERKLRDIAEKTRNKKYTLLIYYTGHGILSSEDYKLYLSTYFTNNKDLEIEGINIDTFKRYIKKSYAGRKIVIIDCCHSGAIIGAMSDRKSLIQSGLNSFEGTYVMTSTAEDMPSLFPTETPDRPTYFTGKLLDILNEGLDIDSEYCSLREIYNQIDFEFSESNLPRPQQSSYNNADQLYFCVNNKFVTPKLVNQSILVDVPKKDLNPTQDYIAIVEQPQYVHIKNNKKGIRYLFFAIACILIICIVVTYVRKDKIDAYVETKPNSETPLFDSNVAIIKSDTVKEISKEDNIRKGIDNNWDEIFATVEIEAEYPGGAAAWQRYLNRNLRYPQEAIDNEVQGAVVVQFIVDKGGNVSNVEAISGPQELRAEAVRVIKKSGKWVPAVQSGRQVKAYRKQPIVFRLVEA